jgi:hypothetical protein
MCVRRGQTSVAPAHVPNRDRMEGVRSRDVSASNQESMSGRVAVVELRRYALHPGQREVLVELFEARFIESQEELGMSLLGQFRDLDDLDSFVWLRGFANMVRRERGLTGFYGGPVWARYRDQANATMIDSDNVLLLKTPSARAAVNVPERDPVAEAEAGGVVAAVIAPVTNDDRALTLFEREIAAAAIGGGTRPAQTTSRACRSARTFMFSSSSSATPTRRASTRRSPHLQTWLASWPTRAGRTRSSDSHRHLDRCSAATARPARSALVFGLGRRSGGHELEPVGATEGFAAGRSAMLRSRSSRATSPRLSASQSSHRAGVPLGATRQQHIGRRSAARLGVRGGRCRPSAPYTHSRSAQHGRAVTLNVLGCQEGVKGAWELRVSEWGLKSA